MSRKSEKSSIVVVPGKGSEQECPPHVLLAEEGEIFESKLSLDLLTMVAQVEALAEFVAIEDSVRTQMAELGSNLNNFLVRPNFPTALKAVVVDCLQRHRLLDESAVKVVDGVRREVNLVLVLDPLGDSDKIDTDHPLYAYFPRLFKGAVDSVTTFAARTNLNENDLRLLTMADQGQLYLGKDAVVSMVVPKVGEIVAAAHKRRVRDRKYDEPLGYLEDLEKECLQGLVGQFGRHCELDDLEKVMRRAVRLLYQDLYDQRGGVKPTPLKAMKPSNVPSLAVGADGKRELVVHSGVLNYGGLHRRQIFDDVEAYRKRVCAVVGVLPEQAEDTVLGSVMRRV